MELEFKHLVLIYSILIALLFLFKPQIFKLNIEDQQMRRHKFVTLVGLFIILAIISYYIKLYVEYYM